MTLLYIIVYNLCFNLFKNRFLISIFFFLAFFQSPSIISKDYPAYWQKLFQSPATHVADGIINLHQDVFALLILIAIFTFWFLLHILFKFAALNIRQTVNVFNAVCFFLFFTGCSFFGNILLVGVLSFFLGDPIIDVSTTTICNSYVSSDELFLPSPLETSKWSFFSFFRKCSTFQIVGTCFVLACVFGAGYVFFKLFFGSSSRLPLDLIESHEVFLWRLGSIDFSHLTFEQSVNLMAQTKGGNNVLYTVLSSIGGRPYPNSTIGEDLLIALELALAKMGMLGLVRSKIPFRADLTSADWFLEYTKHIPQEDIPKVLKVFILDFVCVNNPGEAERVWALHYSAVREILDQPKLIIFSVLEPVISSSIIDVWMMGLEMMFFFVSPPTFLLLVGSIFSVYRVYKNRGNKKIVFFLGVFLFLRIICFLF